MKFKKIAFVIGLAISGISVSSIFAPANAVNFTVLTDTLTNLKISWNVSPIDTGGSPVPKFDIPTAADLINWQIISADYTYHGGGNNSDVAIQAQHIVAPHSGDAQTGDIANIGFSFNYYTPPGGSGTTPVVSVAHPSIGHTDEYYINWNYSYPTGGGTLTAELNGTHNVPEPLTILGSVAAMGFGAYAERKRKPSKSSEKDGTKTS